MSVEETDEIGLDENQRSSSSLFLPLTILILIIAASIRWVGISREPLWLDEIISYNASQGGIAQLDATNANDDHPPLFALGVTVLCKLFGSSAGAVRGTSALMSVIGVLSLVLLGKGISGDWRIGLLAGALAAVNPHDVFYAQEARPYAQAAALGTASSWVLWRWMTNENSRRSLRWPLAYAALALVMCFTLYLGSLVLAAQGVVALLWFANRRRWDSFGTYLAIGLVCIAALGLWLLRVFEYRGTLYRASHLAWIPQPTIDNTFRFLVRDFYSGCGTAISQANFVAWSILFLLGCTLVWTAVRAKSKNSSGSSRIWMGMLFSLWLLVGPVLFAVFLSLAYHPIYFPPRFSLLVLPHYLVLLAMACFSVQSRFLRMFAVMVLLGFMSIGTVSGYVETSKRGMKEFAGFWKSRNEPDIALFFPRRNEILASHYVGKRIPYRKQRSIAKHLRLGDGKRIWLCVEENYQFESTEEEEYRDWLLGLGPHKELGFVDEMRIVEVEAQPFDRVYPSLPENTCVVVEDEASEPFFWSGWHRSEGSFRWSRGTHSVIVFASDDLEHTHVRLDMCCYGDQHVTVRLNGNALDSFSCSKREFAVYEFEIPSGSLNAENSLEFTMPNAISPKERHESGDARKLAIALRWFEVE
ncbi:MAG: hypothetical protein GY906_13860 [bacterium]|nr:hypothetical protein [bacterium]